MLIKLKKPFKTEEGKIIKAGEMASVLALSNNPSIKSDRGFYWVCQFKCGTYLIPKEDCDLDLNK